MQIVNCFIASLLKFINRKIVNRETGYVFLGMSWYLSREIGYNIF
jgi:hypothetical protein